jgi:DNA-binding NtrC family response regulator
VPFAKFVTSCGLSLEMQSYGCHMVLQTSQAFPQRARSADQIDADNFGPTAKKSTPRRILVVDDEPLIRWSIAETLGDCGYEVVEAHDAASALQMLSCPGAVPDVVLLDLRLPDSSDLGLLAAVIERSPSTRVIIMTAHGSSELSDQARRRGAFGVLDKPFEMNALPAMMARALADPSA